MLWARWVSPCLVMAPPLGGFFMSAPDICTCLIYDILIFSIFPLIYIIAEGQAKTDPATIRAVKEWPIIVALKHLQRFLDFADFYRRFIHYSQVAKPLTHLTSTKVPFCWTPEADATYTKLKHLFTTALVLIHPDISKPFVVEVDASDTGVGAVLSQHSGPGSKQQPCAFFPHHLSPTESACNISGQTHSRRMSC